MWLGRPWEGNNPEPWTQPAMELLCDFEQAPYPFWALLCQMPTTGLGLGESRTQASVCSQGWVQGGQEGGWDNQEKSKFCRQATSLTTLLQAAGQRPGRNTFCSFFSTNIGVRCWQPRACLLQDVPQPTQKGLGARGITSQACVIQRKFRVPGLQH